MAITVEDVARAALAAVATDAGAALAGQWVNRRYEELAGRLHFRHLRRQGQLTVPAVLATGTAAVTRGSASVALTGAGTLPSLLGRQFQAATAWYEVIGQAGAVLTLAVPYAEATNATSAYHVVAAQVALADDVRELGDFVLQRRREQPLAWVTLDQLNRLAPSRQYSTATPAVVCDVGYGRTGRRLVELWPYSSTDEALTYTYTAKPPRLEFRDALPGLFDIHPLHEGVLVDVMRYKAATAANDNKIELAAYWRNESRAQDTKWQQLLHEFSRRDRAHDDQTFGLGRNISAGRGDITTAYDEVLARGNRP